MTVHPGVLGALLVSCLCGTAWAQDRTLTIGFRGIDNSAPSGPDVAPVTYVSLAPATATGSVNQGYFEWSLQGCPAVAKIKIFRQRGEELTLVAERGPFDAPPGLPGTQLVQVLVPLSPPIEVEQGDLVGLTRLTSCGAVQRGTNVHLDTVSDFYRFAGDVTSVSLIPPLPGSGENLHVFATGTATERLTETIPVAGSTAGDFGSFFHTDVQLSNTSNATISGRFVFHPAGSTGSPDDPAVNFSAGAGATVSYSDIVSQMGQSGLGSIDIVQLRSR